MELPPREPSLAIDMPDGAREHYKIAATEPGWNGSVIVTIKMGRHFDLGTYPAILIDGEQRTQGSFSAYQIQASTSAMQYVGVFWPKK